MVTFGEGLAGSTFLTKHQTTSQTPWAESQWTPAMGSAAIVYIRKPTASSVITSRRTKKSGPQSPSNTPSIIHQNIRPPSRAHGAEWRAPEHRSREAQRAACRSAPGRRSRQALAAVWNEPDLAARHKLVTDLWSAEGTYSNESQEQHGHRAIETVVSHAYHEFVEKGFIVRPKKNADGHHNVVHFNWDMVPAHGKPVAATGFDFFVLGEDGRIRCDYQFTEPIPAR